MANVPSTFCLESRMGTLQQARNPKLNDKVTGGAKAMIVGDVFDNGGFVAEGRRTAGAHFRADFQPVHALHVGRRQSSSRTLQQVLPLFVQQEDRAIAIRGHALNRGGQGVQDLFERAALGDQLQNVPFLFDYARGTLQLFLIPLAFGQAPALQVSHRASGKRKAQRSDCQGG